MAYTIFEIDGPFHKADVATVLTLGDARQWADDMALETPHGQSCALLAFDIDPDHDAADFAVSVGSQLYTYTVEPTS